MQIYLPIADMPVDPTALLVMGAAVGFISGMFGVGGGFLMTPLLIFYGVPPAVAVGTETVHIVASSASGAMPHLRRQAIDYQMAAFLIGGGWVGAIVGVIVFRHFRATGQIDLFVSLAYVFLLLLIGALMLLESIRAILREPQRGAPRRRRRRTAWMAALAFPMRFRKSQLYISPLPPMALGFFGGLLSAMLGVGSGFVLVPAMIYILQMPANVVVGTSLFQMIFVTALSTMLHATANQTVDIALAALLVAGGVIGAQAGVRVGARLKAEHLRGLLALIVLAVCARLALGL
ncbi:MAG TPA: sulfite exporter TauE/SafE family protein, partial [Parvularculaceae bacterium]|nr:sulfite exporter TauE/SafE family protein [Parvularculaceae bacterium]